MKTKAKNEMTLRFPSHSSNEGFARTAVACFAAQMDPTLNELEDIKTAVSEAVTNAIVHGYPDRIGDVQVKARILPEHVLELTVRDQGRGIQDVEKAREPKLYPHARYTNILPTHSPKEIQVKKIILSPRNVPRSSEIGIYQRKTGRNVVTGANIKYTL